jgi:WD40 repeat protein
MVTRVVIVVLVMTMASVCRADTSDVRGLFGLARDISQDLEFTHDGSYLASQVNDWSICVWSLPSGRLVSTLSVPKPYETVEGFSQRFPDYIIGYDFDESQSRTRLVAEMYSGRLLRFDIRGEQPPEWLPSLGIGNRPSIMYGHFIRYGYYIQGVDDTNLYVVDLGTHSRIPVRIPFSNYAVYGVPEPTLYFSAGARTLLASPVHSSHQDVLTSLLGPNGYSAFRLIDPANAAWRKVRGDFYVRAADVSRDGGEVASFGFFVFRGQPVGPTRDGKGVLTVWSARTNRAAAIRYPRPAGWSANEASPVSLALSDDGDLVAYVDGAYYVYVSSTSTGKLISGLNTRDLYYKAAQSMGFTPVDMHHRYSDGVTLYAYAYQPGHVRDLAISPNKRFVVVAMPGTVLLWDLKSGAARLLPTGK